MIIKIPTLDKLYSFKEKLFTTLKIDKPVKFLISLGFTPNLITCFSVLIGFMSILFLFKNQTLFCNSLCDKQVIRCTRRIYG